MNDATKEELLEILIEKEDEIDWLKAELDESTHIRKLSDAECVTLRKERDEARLQTGRILNEIDCRIEHGADSNGHLEAIRNLFKENTNG